MARRIILLEKNEDDAANRASIKLVMWFDIPASRQRFYARVGAVSAFIDATGAENTAIANGSVYECPANFSFPGSRTTGQIQTALEQQWTAKNAQVQAHNPWNRYGSSLSADGLTWTIAGAS